MNAWTDAEKLQWLKVRLTGRAQTAFQCLSAENQADFARAIGALKERFEPASRKHRYQAELQTRKKRKTESWADFADDLKVLADKAYPELEEKARERLALNAYLPQLDNPQVAFGVKQKTPETLDAAVSATLEMEAYATPKSPQASVSCVEDDSAKLTCEEDVTVVAGASTTDKLASLVEKLVDRVEKLETRGPARYSRSNRRRGDRDSRSVVCWKCGNHGHISRNCTSKSEN